MSQSLSKDDQYIFDWAKEAVRWSRAEHERSWCAKHLITYQGYRNIALGDVKIDDPHLPFGVGLTYPMLKTVSSKLMSPWQAGDRIMDAVAAEELGRSIAPKRAAFVNNHLVNEIPRSFSNMELTKESGILFGRGILKLHHVVAPPMTILERLSAVVEGTKLGTMLGWNRRGPTLKLVYSYVDPFEFHWVGSGRFFEDCDFCVERAYPTESSIWRKLESGEWKGVEPEDMGGGGTPDEYRMKRMDLEDRAWSIGSMGPPEHRVDIVQGWVETKKRANGKRIFEQRLVEILDDKVMVKNRRLETYDGKPGYVVWEPQLDCGGPGSIGFAEPAAGMLATLDEWMQIAMDNGRLAMETPMACDPDALENDSGELYTGAQAVNWIRGGPSLVGPINTRDLPPSFYQMASMLMENIQRITGSSDQFAGMPSDQTGQGAGGNTARGLQLMTNLAASRITPIAAKMDRELYRIVARWIDGTAKQRMMAPQPVRMPLPKNPESPFETIYPDDFGMDLHFFFNTKALNAATGQRRQDLLETVKIIGEMNASGALGAQGAYLDVLEVARLLLGMTDFEEEADRIIKMIPQMLGPDGLPLPTVQPGGPMAAPGQPSMPGRPQQAGWNPSVDLPGVDGAAGALGVQ